MKPATQAKACSARTRRLRKTTCATPAQSPGVCRPGSRSPVGSGVDRLATTHTVVRTPTAIAAAPAVQARSTGQGELFQRARTARVSAIPRTRASSDASTQWFRQPGRRALAGLGGGHDEPRRVSARLATLSRPDVLGNEGEGPEDSIGSLAFGLAESSQSVRTRVTGCAPCHPRRRSWGTSQAASPAMRHDILLAPARRSRKVIGTSTTRKPRRTARCVSSTWNA